MIQHSLDFKHQIAALLLIAVIGVCSFFSKNHAYIGSDPLGTLIVTDQILENGTIKLDAYGPSLSIYGARIHQKNGHSYNYFPLGTALACLPVVAVLKAAGMDIQNLEPLIQIGITALTSILTFGLLVRLALLFRPAGQALLISCIFWFGTSLASTAGTALWSHNFAVVFALTALIYMMQLALERKPRVWIIVALCLFASYLCRPTMSLFVLIAIGFIASYDRVQSFKVILLDALLFLIFVLFSQKEFGQLLPDYYVPNRLGEGASLDAWAGNFFSPARGLLVFSPFLLVVWLKKGFKNRGWRLKPSWLLIGVLWPALHLWAISKFSPWWGGHAFGSRLTTDILPGLFLLTLYAWPRDRLHDWKEPRRWMLGIACIFSIYVHTVQGLMNEYTSAWNRQPDIDQHSEYLFDWSYPQFLANEEGHIRRLQEAQKSAPPVLH